MQIVKMQLREKSVKFLMVPKSESLVLKVECTYSLPKTAEKTFSAIANTVVTVNDASEENNLISEARVVYALKIKPSLPYNSENDSRELTEYLQPLLYASFKSLFLEIGLPEVPIEKFQYNS